MTTCTSLKSIAWINESHKLAVRMTLKGEAANEIIKNNIQPATLANIKKNLDEKNKGWRSFASPSI